ncbi:hypothetical protein [Halospeciosus flavus]|uniref:Uncharacterized protein n=1 Tax=Halospeciosus flavus TaxID=3032283 RepID=A0ABD5Z1I9_9EURY|nr:hypothetical protein [Halospeciosus flavus]
MAYTAHADGTVTEPTPDAERCCCPAIDDARTATSHSTDAATSTGTDVRPRT